MRCLRLLLVLLFTVTLVASCNKEEETLTSSKPQGKYLVSAQKLFSYSKQEIISTFGFTANYIPEIGVLTPKIKYGTDVYKLSYKTKLEGKEITASGLVCFPQVNDSLPILSFQNGTITCDSLAPSNDPKSLLFTLVSMVSGMGYIAVIPDYPGFGESKSQIHPYLIKDEIVRSLIDMFLAVKEVNNVSATQSKPSSKLYLLGYSFGGWATLALHKELETVSNSGFDLKASVCGAGAFNLPALNQYVISCQEYPEPFLLAYMFNTYKQKNLISNSLTDFFQPNYANAISTLFDKKKQSGAINSALTTNLSLLLNNQFRINYQSDSKYAEYRNLLLENSITPWKTNIPIQFYHSEDDQTIPVEISKQMMIEMKNEGSAPQLIDLELIHDKDHNQAAIPAVVNGLLWISGIPSK